FQLYRHHRNLHSFPTRRSSDLKEVQSRIPWGTVIVFGIGISLGTALLTTQAGQWLGQQVVVRTGLDAFGPLGVFSILAAFLILIDRKSTRLNSSHVKISYAVFC